jgi:hypothetical protein
LRIAFFKFCFLLLLYVCIVSTLLFQNMPYVLIELLIYSSLLLKKKFIYGIDSEFSVPSAEWRLEFHVKPDSNFHIPKETHTLKAQRFNRWLRKKEAQVVADFLFPHSKY